MDTIKTDQSVTLRFCLKWPSGMEVDLRKQTGCHFSLDIPISEGEYVEDDISDIGYDKLNNQIWVRISSEEITNDGVYMGCLQCYTEQLQHITTGDIDLFTASSTAEIKNPVILSPTVSVIGSDGNVNDVLVDGASVVKNKIAYITTSGGGGDTSDCVHKTGAETITGVKTFSDDALFGIASIGNDADAYGNKFTVISSQFNTNTEFIRIQPASKSVAFGSGNVADAAVSADSADSSKIQSGGGLLMTGGAIYNDKLYNIVSSGDLDSDYNCKKLIVTGSNDTTLLFQNVGEWVEVTPKDANVNFIINIYTGMTFATVDSVVTKGQTARFICSGDGEACKILYTTTITEL